MKGKKLKSGEIENALNRFLKDEQHLVLGFKKGESDVSHQIFKGNLDHYSLLNPVFGANAALYLRRLFSKGSPGYAHVETLRDTGLRGVAQTDPD